MLTENPDVFLQDFGVVCSSGGRSFMGLLDTPDETLNMGGINLISTMYVLAVKSADVAQSAIATGSAITVGGKPYVVRDVLQQDDGVFSNLTLSY